MRESEARPRAACFCELATITDMRPPRLVLDRRVLLRSGVSSLLLAASCSGPSATISPRPALAEDEYIENYGGTKLASGTAGKARPETGCILLEQVQSSGDANAPTISAELVTNGGVAATVAFESTWPVARGTFFDVEARSPEGDSAYVHVRKLPSDKDVLAVKASYLTDSVFNKYGRFSAYGPPTDIKVLSDATKGQTRYLEINFSVLSASGLDSPRKGVIAAIQPEGSSDAIMLVSSATSARWKKSGSDARARQAADSFRVAGTRTTKNPRAPSSDYRFGTEGQSNVERRNVEGEGTARFSSRIGAE